MSTLHLQHALVGGTVEDDVRVGVEGGVITEVLVGEGVSRLVAGAPRTSTTGVPPASTTGAPGASTAGAPRASTAGAPGASTAGAPRASATGAPGTSTSGPSPASTSSVLPGITLPGLANCHSHAFHRALRARTQAERGSFWTWREQMYRLAEELTPDSYKDLATEVYREMRATGITAVGEFHYLHHQPDGTPYADPNEMGRALLAAADDAGIRIRLLDACYLAAGFGQDLEGAQRRFGDGDATRWAERVEAFGDDRVGAAIHSVRAVPRDQLRTVAAWAQDRGVPLHVHLSEQVAENDACEVAHGLTPTQLLAEEGVLGPMTTAVHATHLTEADVRLLGDSGTVVCLCPTTERDLADGIGPARFLQDAGCRLTLGSDSHAVIDLFEEMRAVEMHERLATRQRGHWTAAELLAAATYDGHASLGFTDAGRLAEGQRADLVTVGLESWRTRGTGATAETLVFAATGADVVGPDARRPAPGPSTSPVEELR